MLLRHPARVMGAVSRIRSSQRAVLGVVALVQFGLTTLPVVMLSARTDMQGEPSRPLAYVVLAGSAVFSLAWFAAALRWRWVGGVAATTLSMPALLIMLVLQAQGVLPDLDLGLYTYAYALGLAAAGLLATLSAEYLLLSQRPQPEAATAVGGR
ncbi:hypothetical protein [Ornithinimicrobium kibberense]|uniref:Uncharacterized protein n=1 Tax=Ornithinimicrobium kibberense TaxID=282060 RepID=A0ABV5V0F0_9MICO|nr:hypothetical protein [Ornithinimicrobium kibberense]